MSYKSHKYCDFSIIVSMDIDREGANIERNQAISISNLINYTLLPSSIIIDPTKSELQDKLFSIVTNKDLSNYGSIMMFIMSHGENESIILKDKEMKLSEIFGYFKS